MRTRWRRMAYHLATKTNITSGPENTKPDLRTFQILLSVQKKILSLWRLSRSGQTKTNEANMPKCQAAQRLKLKKKDEFPKQTDKMSVPKHTVNAALHIIRRPTVWMRNKIYYEALLSHNVNLQTILYPQQIYRQQNWSKGCDIRRPTKTWVRSLWKPITPYHILDFHIDLLNVSGVLFNSFSACPSPKSIANDFRTFSPNRDISSTWSFMINRG